MAEPSKWEYRVTTLGNGWSSPKDEEMEELLNDLGDEGWEIIALHNVQTSSKVRVTAKRPLTLRTRRERSMPSIDG